MCVKNCYIIICYVTKIFTIDIIEFKDTERVFP